MVFLFFLVPLVRQTVPHCKYFGCFLETVEDDVLPVAYFLVDEEVLDVGTLVTTQLDDFTDVLILLDGTVATEILLEGFADPFDV